MSKITPKNLSYDTSLPPFLQRLRGEHAGAGDGRHERAIARPRRARDADADAEDEPTYVDEETNNTLSKEEYAALVGSTEAHEKDGAEEGGDEAAVSAPTTESRTVEKENLAGIGGQRKRKVGKVVGADEDGEVVKKSSEGKAEPSAGEAKKVDATKSKKKGKKIKLSFNDDEGL